MAVYKDSKTNKWTCYVRYEDWQGVRKAKKKEGFKTRREAVEFEHNFIALKTKDINMGFSTFIDSYLDDIKPQLKLTTLETKMAIIEAHIRPYFANKALCDITVTDILQWQNEHLNMRDSNDRAYSPTYLRTIQNQLSAIFNHACRFYDLPSNPCNKLKKMGRTKSKEMLFWTQDEYTKFSEAIKDKPMSYYAFQILYWTGIRCGELLALERADIDLEKRLLRVDKNYQVVKGKASITTPKTEKSNRTIDLPDFLCRELEDYFGMLYKIESRTRLFQVTKSYLHHEMDRGSARAGVKRIRIHDLRHSSCALMIELGYSPVQIAERLGHESVTITERYSHLYPSVQKKIADSMNQAFMKRDRKDGVE